MIDRAIDRLIRVIKTNTESQDMYIAALQVLIGAFLTLGSTLVAIGSGFALAMSDSTGEQFYRNWIISSEYYAVGMIILVFGIRIFGKAFFRRKKKEGYRPQSTKLEILVDEMLDGTDETLRNIGHEALSVKKLREKGEKLQSDYSILKYAEAGNMVLITEDDENIQGCKENGIRVIKHGQNETFDHLMSELKSLRAS